METEVWKPVVGYESRYEVSNLWRIKSKNYLNTNNERLLRIWKTREKWYVSLYNIKRKTFLVSRLVAIAFIENPLNLPCVCHKYETLDSRWMLYDWVDNLWWWTHKENTQDMIKKWRRIKTSPQSWKWKFWINHNRSIKINQFSLLWEFIQQWESWMDIKRTLWLNNKNISSCCLWKRNNVGGFIWKYSE